MKLSIIIPVYNEKDYIEKVLARIESVPCEKEIIIVDDGSDDGTRDILTEIEKKRKAKVIYHAENRGKGAAIRTALGYVSGEVIIIQDADLEYDPHDYQKLVQPILENRAEVVYGSRKLSGENGMSYLRYLWGGIFLTWVTNILYGSHITDESTGYKVFKAEVLKGIDLKSNGFEFCPEVTARLLKRGFKIHEVPVVYNPRKFSEGKKIKWRDGITALRVLIKYKFTD